MGSDVKIALDTCIEKKEYLKRAVFFCLGVGQAGGLDPLCLLLRKM